MGKVRERCIVAPGVLRGGIVSRGNALYYAMDIDVVTFDTIIDELI